MATQQSNKGAAAAPAATAAKPGAEAQTTAPDAGTVNSDLAGQAQAASDANAAAPARKRAAPSNFLPIVRGRLPLLFVHAIRFDETLSKMSTKDVADKFATSVGKVFDVRKNRNFAYIGKDWKPSAEDVGAAEGWINQVGGTNAKGVGAKGDKSVMQTVLDQYKSAGLASAEQAAAQAAARSTTRAAPAAGPNGGAPAAKQALPGGSGAPKQGSEQAGALLG